MSVGVAIPVFGRLPLVMQTVLRMKNKNKVDHIVCVCSTDEDYEFCKSLPCDVLMHDNSPLSDKWNFGWHYLMTTHNPDYFLFAGSSDWLSDNWMEVTIPYLQLFDSVGVLGMWCFDVGQKENRLAHWPGYVGERSGDTIGIGRVLRADLVKKMQGKPFREGLNVGLDWSMTCHIAMLDCTHHVIESPELKALSLSCYRWENKHKFAQHWSNQLPSTRMQVNPFMDDNFPEYKLMNL